MMIAYVCVSSIPPAKQTFYAFPLKGRYEPIRSDTGSQSRYVERPTNPYDPLLCLCDDFNDFDPRRRDETSEFTLGRRHYADVSLCSGSLP